MSKKDKTAARKARAADSPRKLPLIDELVIQGRAAVLPEWLQEGREIWFWRETYCYEGDLCTDSITPVCPYNRRGRIREPEEVLQCARRHPLLTKADVWSVSASFEPLGIFWTINECYTVRDNMLRLAFFPTQADALDHKPEVILYG